MINALEFWWFLPIGIVLLLAAAAAGYWWLRRDTREESPVAVANAGFVRSLESVRRRMAIYHLLIALAAMLAIVAGVAAAVMASRPADRSVERPELATRDIVICLDVSGSMLGYDVEIVETFLAVVDDFAGERIALSIWNETSRTVFPLTDDYDLVTEQLTIARDAMDISEYDLYWGTYTAEQEQRYLDFTSGTVLDFEGENSSLIGDGLASCGLLFDEADTERSRSVLIASDNEVFGTSVFTLDEAAALVSDRGISMVGIFGGDPLYGDATGFESAMLANDGLFYEASDPSAVPGILDAVASQQAVDLEAAEEIVVTDRPGAALGVLAVFALAAFALAWAVRE